MAMSGTNWPRAASFRHRSCVIAAQKDRDPAFSRLSTLPGLLQNRRPDLVPPFTLCGTRG